MSQKLPIAETAIQSVQFASRHIWTAIRLGWLPVIVSCLLYAGGLHLFSQVNPDLSEVLGGPWHLLLTFLNEGTFSLEQLEAYSASMEASDMSADLRSRLLILALSIPSTLVIAPLYVLFYNLAAGDPTVPGGLIYWKWGPRETVFAITVITFSFVMIFGSWGMEELSFLLAGNLETTGDVTISWASTLVPFLIFLVTIWVIVRTLLIPVASAVEGQFNATEAFRATGGNFFRILGSGILTMLLILACLLAVLLAAFIVSLVVGTVGMNFGDDTAASDIMALILKSFRIVVGVLLFIFLSLISFGWYGGAWASLRK